MIAKNSKTISKKKKNGKKNYQGRPKKVSTNLKVSIPLSNIISKPENIQNFDLFCEIPQIIMDYLTEKPSEKNGLFSKFLSLNERSCWNKKEIPIIYPLNERNHF